MALALEQGDVQVVIEPRMGSAITRYSWRGRNVLRPAAQGAASPVEMSCFPLVPFANRIAYGTFRWQGRTITLPRNFGDDPHAIHGQGWQAAWQVIEQSPAHAVTVFDHDADAWPWAYRATLHFSLDGGSLTVALSLTNRGNDPMPASLGFHPYFPKYRESRLAAAVEAEWLTDSTLIPSMRTAPVLDFAKGVLVETAPPLDNCFTGWPGRATIDQPDMRVVLEADARFLQIFVPAGAGYFCAEPMTAMPDAVHRSEPPQDTGLLALGPDATYTVSMTIAPEERAA